MEFKAEVNQILDIVIHSLYSHKEIFLRELISNASDAIDKAKYESLTNNDIIADGSEWKIVIYTDEDGGTITISDNGIGLTNDDAIRELGTIAHSGTVEFLKMLREKQLKDSPELIGQFGVGFYSAFMVADKVTVLSKKASDKTAKAIKWESEGKGSFTIGESSKTTKGTDIILHLKEDDKKYLNEWEIKEIIRKYSDYIEHPIYIEVERERESSLDKSKKVKEKELEKINSQKALWLKDKSSITDNEYNEFYKLIGHDFTDPFKVIHYKAEGTSEFYALIYIPSHIPYDIFFKDFKIGLALYVKKVQIMDHCEELIPRYLRFLKGVVDSSDLPLNISREMLQNNKNIEIINKNITKKILDTLNDLKKKDLDKYIEFFKQFGKILKEGIHFDFEKRKQLADLMLFPSTKTQEGIYTTIAEYVSNMKDQQEGIYYITSKTKDDAMKSPYVETFLDKDIEVLIMLDEVDDIIFNTLDYDGKKFKSVIKGEIKLDKSEEKEKKEQDKKYKNLLDTIKEHLIDDIKEVRLSSRLKESPCCLVTDEGMLDPAIERMMRDLGQTIPSNKRILEINPSHVQIQAIYNIFDKTPKSKTLLEYIDVLYEQALLLEGAKPKDAAKFSKAIASLMVDSLKVSS
ncbi:heat shock protein 90 [Candidatus Magnetoovum chiemensis]|nr:heat shock protein 90 [Candidatus Magnetoovum chiemensis]